jgi:copper chaperone CopZ
MSCSGCVKNITRALQTLPTTEVLATDLPTKTVHVRYDTEQVTMDTIKTTLSTAKYPVAGDQPIEHVSEEVSTAH